MSGAASVSWLTNARTTAERSIDIGVADGRIAEIVDHGEPGDRAGVDLGGWLLLPAMAEPHAHLDKALTADLVPNPAGDLMGAIEGWIAAAAAGKITEDGITERAIAAMELLLVHGVTAVRTHVNVIDTIGASAVRAVRRAAETVEGLLDVQIVGLVGSQMMGPEGAGMRAALSEALEVGLDFVGGCPHLEEDGLGVIDLAISAATEAGIGIDLHVDETLDPTMLRLETMAERIIETGFDGLVAASHCVSLGMQPVDVQARVAAKVAEAGISVFPLPQTNLFLQGRDHPEAMPRGLTALRALDDAGVLVAAGADNVQDPFNLVGRSDPLETAALMVMAGHKLPDDAYDLVSNNARRAMGLDPVTISVGDPADLVAIDAPTLRGAIADAPMSRRVFRHGRLVASADQSSAVHR